MNQSAPFSSTKPVFQLPHACHMDLTVCAGLPLRVCVKKKRPVCRFVCTYTLKVLWHVHLIPFVVSSQWTGRSATMPSVLTLVYSPVIWDPTWEDSSPLLQRLVSSWLLSWGLDSNSTQHVYAQPWIINDISLISSAHFIFRMDAFLPVWSSYPLGAQQKRGFISGITRTLLKKFLDLQPQFQKTWDIV